MVTHKTYRITMFLTEPEAIALARLAHTEFREMRTQAHHIVYRNLIATGLLPELPPEPVTLPKHAIS